MCCESSNIWCSSALNSMSEFQVKRSTAPTVTAAANQIAGDLK